MENLNVDDYIFLMGLTGVLVGFIFLFFVIYIVVEVAKN